MDFKKIIAAGDVGILRSSVFEQKLDANSQSSYTAVLDEAEENEVSRKIAVGQEYDEWGVFLYDYLGHYAPFKSTVKILVDHLDNAACRKILLKVIRDYGLTFEEFSWLFCKIKNLLSANVSMGETAKDWTYLLVMYCRFSKIYSAEVQKMLKSIDFLNNTPGKLEGLYEKRFSQMSNE